MNLGIFVSQRAIPPFLFWKYSFVKKQFAQQQRGTEKMKRRFTAAMFRDALLTVLSWQNKLDGSSARDSVNVSMSSFEISGPSDSPVNSDSFHSFWRTPQSLTSSSVTAHLTKISYLCTLSRSLCCCCCCGRRVININMSSCQSCVLQPSAFNTALPPSSSFCSVTQWIYPVMLTGSTFLYSIPRPLRALQLKWYSALGVLLLFLFFALAYMLCLFTKPLRIWQSHVYAFALASVNCSILKSSFSNLYV